MQHPQSEAHHASPVAPQKPADEISLKDILKEFSVWKRLIRNNFLKIILVGVIGGTIGFVYAYFDTPVYTAKTRFMLKNEGVGSLFGGQMSSLTGILGGGQMGTPLERTAEVIASDRIVGQCLLKDMTIGDTTDLVINHFIRLTDLRKAWAKDSVLKNIRFDRKDVDIESLSLAQRKVYKQVKSMLTPEKGDGVVQKAFEKKSGVLTLTCVHRNEAFAIGLSNIIYAELSSFFVEQMTFTSVNNAVIMKKKLDSIQGQLNYVRWVFAQQTDQSQGLLLQQDKIDLKSLAIKEQMLTVMYAEALKNYESFQFMNSAAMPSLTLIDHPYSPINPSKKSRILYSILIAGFFLFVFVVAIRVKMYMRKVLRS